MSDKKIICLINGRERSYYLADKTFTEYLDSENRVVRVEGTLPDGNVLEVSVPIQCEKSYLQGKLHGTLTKYNTESGKFILTEKYSNGLLDGDRTVFYDNGEVKVKQCYKNGKLHGLSKEYYSSGDLKLEDTYESGKLTFRKEYKNFSFGNSKLKPVKITEESTDNVEQQSYAKDVKLPASKNVQEISPAKEETVKPSEIEVDEKPINIKCSADTSVDESNLSFITRKTTNDCRLYYQNDEVIAKEIFNQNGVVIDSIGTIPDGVVKEFYPSNKLKLEEIYKTGRLNGLRKKFDETGRLWAEETYSNGRLNGIVRVHNYFKDKVFEEEAYFKNDKLHGVRKTFYPNGRVSVEENYIDGKLTGSRKSYYENGQVNTQETYENALLNGLRKKYYDSGQVWNEETYKNGNLQGVKKDFYISGQLRYEEFYENGKLEGKRKFYFESGKIMYEETYFRGTLQERNEYQNVKMNR